MFLPFTLLHYLKQNDPYFFLPIMFLKLFSSLEDKGSEIPVLFHFFIFTFQKEIMRKLILCSAFHLRKIKIKFIDTILINLTQVEVEALVIQGPKLATVMSQVKKLEVSVLVLGQKKPSPLLSWQDYPFPCNFTTFNLYSNTSKPFFILSIWLLALYAVKMQSDKLIIEKSMITFVITF